MDTPNPETPVTPADSQGGSLRPESTLPSSPPAESVDQETMDHKLTSEGIAESADSIEDTEGMDTKAKALMHLLKTSSVGPILWWRLVAATDNHCNIGLCGYHGRQNEEAAGRS